MKSLLIVAAAGLLANAPVHAQDMLEQVFGFGQFAGAASFCGVPRPDVLEVSGKLLKSVGINSDGPGPEMTRFTEGVAAGVAEMKGKATPNCDEVTTAFADARSKLR